jgi:hypothetical protein
MTPALLHAVFSLALALQSPDPRALAEDLTRKYLEQNAFALSYGLRNENDPPDAPALSSVEVAVDLPHGKIFLTLRTIPTSVDGPHEQHYFLDGLVLRSWGTAQEPLQIDYDEGTREYRDSQKALLRTLLQLAPNADTSGLEFLPWLPSLKLGLARPRPPQAYGDLTAGIGPVLCGNVASWLNAGRYLENVGLKEEGDFYEFGLSDGRSFRTERRTGLLHSFAVRNADGSRLSLSLTGRRLERPFPDVAHPRTLRSLSPTRDWDRQLGAWHAQILERVITVFAAHSGRMKNDSDRAEFLQALSRSAALCADCLERSFLDQNASDQVTKLLRSGLTPSELHGDAAGLRAGYIASYEKGKSSFQNNVWKSLDETLFLDFRMRIRETLKASNTTQEFSILQALDRELAAPFQKHPDPERIGRIFLEELERRCGK